MILFLARVICPLNTGRGHGHHSNQAEAAREDEGGEVIQRESERAAQDAGPQALARYPERALRQARQNTDRLQRRGGRYFIEAMNDRGSSASIAGSAEARSRPRSRRTDRRSRPT